MLSRLQTAREIELSKNKRNICRKNDFKSSLPGLARRGLVNTKKIIFEGKEVHGVFITPSGINFLDRYHEDLEKFGVKIRLPGEPLYSWRFPE